MIPFSGYEEDVYRVEGPHRLPGTHAQLIAAALRPDERVLHLLIGPIWDSARAPFGVQAPRASHAFCLTDSRLLVSRDPHRRQAEPTTFSIDRHVLTGLEFGQALLMSWLALYVRRGRTVTKGGFYFPRHGNELVAALLRTWREAWPLHPALDGARPVLPRGDVFEGAGYFHQRLLRRLLLGEESCLRTCQRPPIWGSKPGWFGRRLVGLAHWGTLLLTERSFYYVCGQPPLGRRGYVFAHNVLCFSLAALRRAECRAEHVADTECLRLVLTLDGEGGPEFGILFPKEQAALAAQWARTMTTLASHGECASQAG